MGFDNHGTNFLRYALRKQPFGAVATIGRQELHINGKLAKKYELDRSSDGKYCEDFLRRFFEATVVDSFDNSSYENATHLADLSRPISGFDEYDTVIDAGTLEHIYNVTQALSNLSQLCRVGGQIIHVLPANNECGHGFWQFAPELFYSLYSEANGYADTNVFVASRDDEDNWYEVKKPGNGERSYIQSLAPLSILCRTRKISRHEHANVQQSDYSYVWSVTGAQPAPDERHDNKPIQGGRHGYVLDAVKRQAWAVFGKSPWALTLFRAFYALFLSKTMVSTRNPYLTKTSVADAVKRAASPVQAGAVAGRQGVRA